MLSVFFFTDLNSFLGNHTVQLLPCKISKRRSNERNAWRRRLLLWPAMSAVRCRQCVPQFFFPGACISWYRTCRQSPITFPLTIRSLKTLLFQGSLYSIDESRPSLTQTDEPVAFFIQLENFSTYSQDWLFEYSPIFCFLCC